MTYDLSDTLDLRKADARYEAMKLKGAVIDLTEKAPRSGNQNRYVHALLGAIAMETGNTLEYVKTHYFKVMLNKDLFVVEKYDPFLGKVVDIRSSADLTKEEMSTAIDRFRNWAASEGYYLPEPGDDQLIRKIEFEMGKQRQYL